MNCHVCLPKFKIRPDLKTLLSSQISKWNCRPIELLSPKSLWVPSRKSKKKNLSFVNKHVLQNNCLKHEITDVVIALIILIVITGGFQNFQKWGGSVYELCSSLKGLSSSGVPQVPGLDPTILTCQSHHDAMWLHMVSVCLAVQINI